jgi:hypothetical protein
MWFYLAILGGLWGFVKGLLHDLGLLEIPFSLSLMTILRFSESSLGVSFLASIFSIAAL